MQDVSTFEFCDSYGLHLSNALEFCLVEAHDVFSW